MKDFSTKKMSSVLVGEIKKALKSVKDYGSVEIFVQRGLVTQITTRSIKKTNKDKNKKNSKDKENKKK